MTQYTVKYEIEVNGKVVEDEMVVEANSEERATEYAAGMLDQQYDDSVLLECQVTGKRG